MERLKQYCRTHPDNYAGKTFNQLKADELARTTKRLDLCASQVAHVFSISGFIGKYPIKDKVCAELGAGWVLSHSLVMHLLGAEKVIATDIERNAYPHTLRKAVDKSVSSIVRDVLSPYEDHHKLRERINHLHSIKQFSFDTLKELGISYQAPVDLAKNPLDEKVDFVYSNSVLEHVPDTDVLALLNHISSNLSTNGMMLHCIHLEDHIDIIQTPFAFLGLPPQFFDRENQNARGNRLRCSQWEKLLSQVKGMKFSFVYKWQRLDRELPSLIDQSIQYVDFNDLRISHIGVLGIKN